MDNGGDDVSAGLALPEHALVRQDLDSCITFNCTRQTPKPFSFGKSCYDKRIHEIFHLNELANAMSEQKINEAIGALREEGERLDNPEAKERLTNLVDNIEQYVDYSGVSEEHQDLVEDVKEAIVHFEVEHPSITGILNEVMMTLSNMGI